MAVEAAVLIPIVDSLAPETNEQFFLRLDAPFASMISASTGTSVTGTATLIDSFVRGTNGGDVMNGTAFADRVDGRGGNDDTLIGNGGNDTLPGGTGNDRLLGAVGNDVLVGGNGFDTLNGGLSADRMAGGFGNDLYFVDNRFVRIIETAGGGFDTVRSTVSQTLANPVETLILAGNAGPAGTERSIEPHRRERGRQPPERRSRGRCPAGRGGQRPAVRRLRRRPSDRQPRIEHADRRRGGRHVRLLVPVQFAGSLRPAGRGD